MGGDYGRLTERLCGQTLSKVIRAIRRSAELRAYALISPALLYLLIFWISPFVITVLYSFSHKTPFGQQLAPGFVLENYVQVFDPKMLVVYWRSIQMALWTTVLCLIIGYPFAYCLALYSGRMKKVAMILAIMPFWVSFLIRTYALMAILGSNGVINSILLNLGLISKPLELMYNMFGVTVGMVYNYLVLMVLPLYASIEKVDVRVLEAARSLRANAYRTFIWVTLPLTMPGIYAGSVLVFVPAIGEFITPQLLGGAKVWLIGNYIYFLFLKARNYPLGAAHSIILIIIVGAMVILYMRYLGEKVMIL